MYNTGRCLNQFTAVLCYINAAVSVLFDQNYLVCVGWDVKPLKGQFIGHI